MTGNRTLIIGVLAVTALLLSGTLYVAFSSADVNQPDSSTQTATTGTVVSSNSTARIIVSGTGTVSYVPDEAVVSIGIITVNNTVTGATASNANTASNIIKALNSIGIANSSIQTQGYDISPDYNYNGNVGNSPQTIIGYTVTDTLAVNVTAGGCSGCALNSLGQRAAQVIDTASNAGANQISFGFTVSNLLANQLETQALQQAVQDASSQATTIAGAMGVTITGIIQASDTGTSVPQPVTFSDGLTASSVSQSTVILPGTSTVSAAVEIVYGIS